jgi:hypothetical protein
VVDESAAVVPEVLVTVLNLGTGLQRSTIGAAQGTFVVPFLPPGRYRLSAYAPARHFMRPTAVAI